MYLFLNKHIELKRNIELIILIIPFLILNIIYDQSKGLSTGQKIPNFEVTWSKI